MSGVTTSIAAEVDRRTRPNGRRRRLPATFEEALLEDFESFEAECKQERGPLTASDRATYRAEPERYVRERLGIEPWSRQVELIEAVRDHANVAVRSGQKVGKTRIIVALSLWFFEVFEDARILFTAPSGRQVDGVMWRELRKVVHAAPFPIAAQLNELARSGLVAPDLREIKGFTAKETEAVSGTSGANMLYIADESSGIDDGIFDAIDGNRAAGGNNKLVMLSQPTRTAGRFFEAFHARQEHYRCIHIPSTDSPNVKAGRIVVPGLASPEWIDRKREEYGEDSAWFQVRVLGEFVTNEVGRVISLDLITQAEERWDDTPSTGALQIGIDPAGTTQQGDESGFAVRRGKKVVFVAGMRGLTPEAHVTNALGLIDEHGKDLEEEPIIAVDVAGVVGDDVIRAFRAAKEQLEQRTGKAFRLIAVRTGDKARGGLDGRPVNLVRDDLWQRCKEWLIDGGAIPRDAKLERDLHCAQWDGRLADERRGQTVCGKDVMREELGGRSPDRGDAVCLAVWSPGTWTPAAVSTTTHGAPPQEPRAAGLDPYAGLKSWGRR